MARMGEKHVPALKHRIGSSRWIRPGLLGGAVVLGVVLACVIGWSIYAKMGYQGSDDSASGARLLRDSGAPPVPAEVMVEKVVEVAPMEPANEAAAYGLPHLTYAAEHLIIRSGNIAMVVEDTRATQRTIEEMVAGMAEEGAFVVSSNEYGGTEEGQPFITLSIRVPATHFDRVMDRLADLAVKVSSRNESSEDVTEEYVDLEARLESLETARQRLLEIMQETRSTKDLLEAEQQLTQREAEIESIKGRMQYLEQSAQLSSIWIELQPYILSQPVAEQWRPAETSRRAVEALVDGLRSFGDFLIFFAIAILPWLVAIAVVIFLLVRLVRWRTRARRSKRAAAGQTSGQEANGT